MKNIRTFAIAVLAFSLLAPAYSASFMKIEGIKGESVDKDHKEWIDILSVSGLSAPSGTRDAASGLATGKRQHKPVTVTKRIDKASPLLAKSSGNPQFPSTIRLSQDGVDYVLSGVVVTSVRKKAKRKSLRSPTSRSSERLSVL